MTFGKIKIEKNFTVVLKECYVYVHKRKTNNEVFYVGKGSRERWRKLDRNYRWKNIANKHGVVCEIVANSLTNEEACILEKKLINLYGRLDCGTGTLANLTDGGEGVVGGKISDETRAKLREACARTKAKNNNPLRKKIIMDERICFYSTMDVVRFLRETMEHVQDTHVSQVANYKSMSYKGSVFRWATTDPIEFYAKRKELIIKAKAGMSNARQTTEGNRYMRKPSICMSNKVSFPIMRAACEYLVETGKAKNTDSAKATLNAVLRGEIKTAFGETWTKHSKQTTTEPSKTAHNPL